ncbi:unnamed protein product [Euphydryas editha]|uniref:Uncharacterized protein n=1 Tax=Euphydryas editha TaxID=104508 RepID=A0AAU9U8G8_EUPED|nr:unnamed protein product [Euphydryas editha]
MAGFRRIAKRVALCLLFAAANLFASSEAQLTFSSGWGKRSSDDEIVINFDDQLQLMLPDSYQEASIVLLPVSSFLN